MRPFEYLTPAGLEEALEAVAERPEETAPIAGGQSLLLELKSRERAPARLVSLAGVEALGAVSGGHGEIRVGPTVTYRAIADGEAFAAIASRSAVTGFLTRVIANIADRAVRTMATVGGAACQAEPAFDIPVALTVVDAGFEVAGASGTRRVAAHEFFRGVKQTALEQGELLSAIVVPDPAGSWRWGFAKQGMRAHDAALSSVALAVRVDGESRVECCRIVVGGAVKRPSRAYGCETWLIGRPIGEVEAEKLGERLAAEVVPELGGARFGREYRRSLLPALVRRALEEARDEG
ncbi:MAG: FAD binding domain-containing protein [Actinobacteria bacterium]|nr:FAD binding domain-containing protein [Actinomycetota bacterium]